LRYAVLSDIHASVEALRAVLDDVRAQRVERLVCLGDLVGYHAEPDACVAMIRALDPVCVAGNHDRVAAGLAEPRHFGGVARRAALWTRTQLSPESRAYLRALPLVAVVDGRFLIVHGALHPAPQTELHLSRASRVRSSLRALRDGPWGVRLGFFGHTHRGVLHEARADGVHDALLSLPGDVPLAPDRCTLVNPGSVGQSRDGDPRAAYAILDTGAGAWRLEVRRVPFDRDASLAKAARAGLLDPEPGLPHRLRAGLSALARRLG
jgi:predicted phosphodiesterase